MSDVESPGSELPVVLDGVTKTYGEHKAVADLSFGLRAGSITGFLGPNGAGKTTTLRMIGGLVRPTRGEIRVMGLEPGNPGSRVGLGYMPADPSFLAHLSGRSNLDLLAALHGNPDVTDRDDAAKTLDLRPDDLDRPVGGYSSGMKQKLAIVAALQHRPELVVLDEPANRLDPIAHRAFCALLKDTARQGRTVLLSSHVLAEVEAVCDDVLLVRDGRLLASASVEDLRACATRVVTLVYDSPPMTTPPDLCDARVEGCSINGRIPSARADVVRQLLSDSHVIDVTIEPPSLEEVVLTLYTADRQ